MHQIDDCLVLDGLQRGGIDLSGLKVQTCPLQLCRPPKAADMIRTKGGMFFAHEKRSFYIFLLICISMQNYYAVSECGYPS